MEDKIVQSLFVGLLIIFIAYIVLSLSESFLDEDDCETKLQTQENIIFTLG